jgi:hypothetical protein
MDTFGCNLGPGDLNNGRINRSQLTPIGTTRVDSERPFTALETPEDSPEEVLKLRLVV